MQEDSQVSFWASWRVRAIASALIFLHILALVGEPLRMFTQGRQPSAPDARIVRTTLGPYIDFMYLHHGYFFFAPNPGPSHLMDIKLFDEDGTQRHLRLPNHRAQWPRLLYHRHFMLSEFLYQLYTPPPAPSPDGELPPPQLWQRDRAMFERVRSSMEEHLAKRYGAKRAEIQLMEHRLPSAVELFDDKVKLDDEKLYILIPDQPPQLSEPPPVNAPASQRSNDNDNPVMDRQSDATKIFQSSPGASTCIFSAGDDARSIVRCRPKGRGWQVSRLQVPEQASRPSWIVEATTSWNTFWFRPEQPHTLAIIRIFCGAMLAYVHAIWLSQTNDFFGPNAWIDGATSRALHEMDYSHSYLTYVSNPWLIAAHEMIAIVVSLAMMLGWQTRIATPLAWFLTLMVCHRQTGALFGLDQVVMMLSMYLMLSACGDVYSLDAWRGNSSRNANDTRSNSHHPAAKVSNNLAARLLQIHLCIIYLFGGLSKLRGDFWWEGSAMWWSIVNYEYQSLDITWLGWSPMIIALTTHLTLFWETFYPALVWPRLTRPFVLAMAVLVHGGIGLALGMPTFGFMMIVANLVFVSPRATAACVDWISRRLLRRDA